MVKKSRLKTALDAHKGVDYSLEQKKRQRKAAEKVKRAKQSTKGVDSQDDKIFDDEGDVDDDEEDGGIKLDGANMKLSGAAKSPSDKAPIPEKTKDEDEGGDEGEGEDEDEDEEEEDIPLSDIASLSSEQGDIVPHQRLTINNTAALTRSLQSISVSTSIIPFSEHQTVTSSEPIEIVEIDDDLSRELAFYKQSLDAVKSARSLLKREAAPFSRPTDFFAEMVKSDEHMGTVKGKLIADAAAKKAAADARKQRDLKRFGKQVQVAKLQERDKAKKDTLDKIQLLKRKRQSTGTSAPTEEDLFDVALESASKPERRRDGQSGGEKRGVKRQKRDQKFGYGGKKRFSKSGDALSTGDMSSYSAKKMKGGQKRLGKSRRSKA
ncbi:MAG: hypothetical protein M1825_005393 [Sarcosagium campestre]|nr:MAG: hypothetical protein M1825_005393 [Sarcosagium campestre]